MLATNKHNKAFIDIPLVSSDYQGNILDLTPNELYDLNPVVTYDTEGKPKSYFRDLQWNYVAYADQNTNRVNAKYLVGFKTLNISSNLLNELKAAVLHYFIKEYPRSNNARVGQIIFEQTSKFFIDLNKQGKKSITSLNHSILLHETLRRIGTKYALNTLQRSLFGLNRISKLAIPSIRFNLAVENGRLCGSNAENTLNGLAKKYCRKGSEIADQTLYIPSNIHTQMMNSALEMLCEGEKVISRISAFFREYWEVHELSEKLAQSEPEHEARNDKQRSLRPSSIRRYPSRKYRKLGMVTRQELLEKYKLKDIDDAYAATGKGIFYYTGIMAAACYVIIATFSGMREDEVMALKENSFNKKGGKNRKIYYLRSYEKKISGGQYVDYVTSPLAERAIRLLFQLNKPARELIPELKNSQFLCITHPLLRLPTYGVTSLTEHLPKFMSHYNITVNATDLEQHELFNKLSTKYINIGDVWPISTHQFRRTLIVNFLTHCVTGVTQIKQQVKHMYASMTEYYGNDAYLVAALKLVRSEEFKKTLDEEQVNVTMLMYKRFYQSNEHLDGVKGQEIEKQRGLAQQLTDEEIKLLIRTGAFKVTSTPFGHCTKGDLCDKAHIVDPTFCGAKCETMIITRDNALAWQRLYRRNIAFFKSEVIEGFGGVQTMMKAQNAVAVKIMDSFHLSYESNVEDR